MAYAIAVGEIKLSYPPPFWLFGTRWRERPYKGIFRAVYAPKFSPLDILRRRNGRMSYATYRRPVKARWTADRIRQGGFDETVPVPLAARDSVALFELESRLPADVTDLGDAERLLEFYRKIDPHLVLLHFRLPGESPESPEGFQFLGYDHADAQRGSRIFDLLFQEWAREVAATEFVRGWRRELNANGLLPDLRAARQWKDQLEKNRPHPCCCRGGEMLEIHEQRRRMT
jgi:hypothetical protein